LTAGLCQRAPRPRHGYLASPTTSTPMVVPTWARRAYRGIAAASSDERCRANHPRNKDSPDAGEVVSICCMPVSELALIKQHFGNRPFRVREAVEIGVPRHRIYRLRDEGVLVVLSRGVMQSIESDPAMNTEFAALATRQGKR
jgi:Transcriptional regulator, AbiEi antitoxin